VGREGRGGAVEGNGIGQPELPESLQEHSGRRAPLLCDAGLSARGSGTHELLKRWSPLEGAWATQALITVRLALCTRKALGTAGA